jgi:hypothetical protein
MPPARPDRDTDTLHARPPAARTTSTMTHPARFLESVS